ncbi:hypothetical protein [Nocardia arthritidis]|uniref:Alpha/beta hydrolase n=1 Tax=Nocardia arthritidis TaxID=228602 RepID=A0A6G9YM47_9NOCA|nr:hypothetical protein [Nocardia arthritidis]QIS14106.1 hypothetical protein F5544_31320 [Nocardia arthritidis]
MTPVLRLGRALIALCASGILLSTGTTVPAAAEPPTSATELDPMYAVLNFFSVFAGTLRDLNDPRLAQFWTDFYTSLPSRAGQNFQQLLDPAQYQGLDGPQRMRQTVQQMVDTTIRVVPTIGGASLIPPNPDLLPDWNNDGVYGEVADAVLDNDAPHDGLTARFRFPCFTEDSTITFRTTDGGCAPGDTPGADFAYGVAQKFSVVDSRGFRLSGTMWLPQDALRPGDRKFPVTVFPSSGTVVQSTTYGYTMAAVARGYIGITYDPVGQGTSEGTAVDLPLPYDIPHCGGVAGSCRDLQDVMRWVVDDDIIPVVDLNNELANATDVWRGINFPRLSPRHNPAYAPAGDNIRNPLLDRIDIDRIGIWGQSMSSIAVTNYLWWIGQGHGADGRPLPKPAAAVGLSGFEPTNGDIPTQVQTADQDWPGLLAGSLWPTNPILDPTDGPLGTKAWYDQIHVTGTGHAALQWLTIKGGSHGDTSSLTMVPHTLPARRLSTHYALDWFDCFIQHDGGACARVTVPDPDLSRSVAAEIAPHGSAGPSYCMNVPDAMAPEQILFTPLRDALSAVFAQLPPQPCLPGPIPPLLN